MVPPRRTQEFGPAARQSRSGIRREEQSLPAHHAARTASTCWRAVIIIGGGIPISNEPGRPTTLKILGLSRDPMLALFDEVDRAVRLLPFISTYSGVPRAFFLLPVVHHGVPLDETAVRVAQATGGTPQPAGNGFCQVGGHGAAKSVLWSASGQTDLLAAIAPHRALLEA